MRAIAIPELEFGELLVKDAVASLRDYAEKADPDKRGVNIVIRDHTFAPAGGGASLSLELRDISLYDALRYLCEAAGLSMRIDDNAVVIFPDLKQ